MITLERFQSRIYLKRVVKEIGEQVDEEDLQAMIDEFDLDQDGKSISCFI